MVCPRAKGSTRSMSGLKPVLVNDSSKSFIVDPKVFIVWSLCNGKNTVDDIRVKFGSRIGLDEGEKEDISIPDVINSLQRIGLVEN
ncbi:MAG: hypothetical protein V1744_07865 [Candidatus Altiarchaeota archaeon]